jgi:hypothetical protein
MMNSPSVCVTSKVVRAMRPPVHVRRLALLDPVVLDAEYVPEPPDLGSGAGEEPDVGAGAPAERAYARR